MTTTYFEIDPLAVDPAARRIAHDTLIVVCDDLGIGDSYRPTLRWFSEESAFDRHVVARWGVHFSDVLSADLPGTLEGRTDHVANVVWLRSTASMSELPVTVAHEAAHVALRRLRGPAGSPSEQAHQERMAEVYAQRYRQEESS